MSLHSRWAATTGYDLASGLGRVYGDKFAAAVTEPPPGNGNPPPPPPPGGPTAATVIAAANAGIMVGLQATAGRFKFPWASVKAVLSAAAKDTQASTDAAITKAMP
jgi:hypothetical protein